MEFNSYNLFDDEVTSVTKTRVSVDNFDLLAPFLKFPLVDDSFYVCEIIKRRKENPTLAVGTKLIDTFYLYDGDLQRKKSLIKELCKSNGARAYLRLNVRSARAVALRTMKKLAELIEQGNYKATKRAYASAAGEVNSAGVDKTWIVDLDERHLPYQQTIEKIIYGLYENKIVQLPPITKVPTVNGIHLICRPFDRMGFGIASSFSGSILCLPSDIRNIDIHKDNPTLLFYSQGE